MSAAHYLTLFRLFLSPLFLIFYLFPAALGIDRIDLPYLLLGVLALAEVTDVLDGFLARRLNQVTDLGKVLDPMADSVLHISVFLAFTRAPVQLPLLLVLVFLYRDSIVGTLRTICALRGFALAARSSGKIKAVIQAASLFCILILMIPQSRGLLSLARFQTISLWITVFAVLYAVISGIDYLYGNRQHIKKFVSVKAIGEQK